jgi:hypothetical protein
MAPPSASKKRKVHLPANEELARNILEKRSSLAAERQPGGLSEHQGTALSAAYRGVCLAKEPFRTPADLARIKYALRHLSTAPSYYAVETRVRSETRIWSILGRVLWIERQCRTPLA